MSERDDVDLHDVRITDLPVAVLLRAREHHATLIRELELIAAARDPDSAPSRLRVLGDELRDRFSSFTAAQEAELDAAIQAGGGTIDLHYRLPSDVVAGAEQLLATLEEVDEFCRRGELLTLLTPPELVAYRRWFLGEFVRQVRDGAAPTMWSPPADGPHEPRSAPSDTRPPTAVVAVRGDLDLELAANLRAELVQHIESGVFDLVVDLRECGFVDSAGLSLLLTTRARCIAGGGSLRVTGVSAAVRRSLEIAEVYDVLVGRDEA